MTEGPERDRDLVRTVLEGETDAFAGLVERYQRMVASVAWRYGAPADDIDDLVSEVFIKVYQNLHRYRPEHPLSTWLYRLAANHVLDAGRRRKREGSRSEMPAEIMDPGAGPREQAHESERAELVRGVLQQLPDHYREVIFLVYVEGLGVKEAARMLGVPTGTVKSRLKRGRDAMRKALVQRYPDTFAEA